MTKFIEIAITTLHLHSVINEIAFALEYSSLTEDGFK